MIAVGAERAHAAFVCVLFQINIAGSVPLILSIFDVVVSGGAGLIREDRPLGAGLHSVGQDEFLFVFIVQILAGQILAADGQVLIGVSSGLDEPNDCRAARQAADFAFVC